MLNSKIRKNSLSEEKVYVLYKDNPPARVVDVEKRGRKIYLLLRWGNFGSEQFRPERWVKDSLCEEFKPTGKGITRTEVVKNALRVFPTYRANRKGRTPLNWFQKLIVKLQNWWYGLKQ
jgi:hypothetical protein